nr:integrase, catalytic region, zinc finger, CCHC-type, peptidase aspartic, catalytic [Tanacetum cinerariifolium]
MLQLQGIWACCKRMSEAKKGKGCSLSQGKDAIVEQIDRNDEDADLAKEQANNKLSEENDLLYADFKKSKAELKRRDSIEYASDLELECAKVRDAQIKLYQSREDKEIEKVIDLENKVKVLDNIVYQTGQSVQMMNMLNNKCRTSFVKPEYLKQANPRLYDIGCYNDNLALMLSPESDETKDHPLEQVIGNPSQPVRTRRQLESDDEMCMFSLTDLKAQLQDKGIVISESKKLIEKLKGKSVDTKFEKSSVIRQPNAFKSQKPLVLGKPTTFSNSFIRKYFSKSTSVTQNNVSNDFSKLVTAQTLPMNMKPCLKNTNVLAPGMYKLHIDHTQARTSKPQLKSNSQGDRVMHNNSQGKKKEVEDHRRSVKLSKNKMFVTACNDSWNAKTLNVKYVSVMYDKCVLIDKHEMCVLKSVDKPLKETVASESNKKPRNLTRKLYERVRVVMIKRVYYVEALNHNLFFIGQFYDADLEVAFRKSTCFIRDLKGNDLLT